MPKTQRFGIERKIIAAMTSEGWRHAPHACFMGEFEAGKLLETLREINTGRSFADAITFNTAMLKIIAEGIKACPKMNAHIRFSRHTARGSVTTFEQIDVTTPVMLDRNTMMTLKLRDIGSKSLSEIRDCLADLVSRAKNTNMQHVMSEVAIHDTLAELKRFRLIKAIGRLIGYLLDGGSRWRLHGADKRAYDAIPVTQRLTYRDLEQGTITVSNPGTLYKRFGGACTILEIVPPQIAAIAINMVRDRVVVDKDGTIRPAKITELTIAFDHRALDASDLVPFVTRVRKLIESPEPLKGWV